MDTNFRIPKHSVPISILDASIPTSRYCPLDLSSDNKDLEGIRISNADECQKYILKVLKRNNALVAYGGYLEKRNLYEASDRFKEGKQRNIHLGVDFWCEAGTAVLAPIDGKIHSFANNEDFGNYGPTIILEHEYPGGIFYSLYGHLSLSSLEGLSLNQDIKKGQDFATLGTPDINVGYAPHLHFQVILDIGAYKGDYPGVCAADELAFYKNNCPDPKPFLGVG